MLISAAWISGLGLLLATTAHAAPWMVVDPNQFAVTLSSGSTGARELSGLTWIGGNEYYAVSDQTQQMFPLTINLNSATGAITSAVLGSGVSLAGSDLEDIAFHPPTGDVLVADEVGPQIRRHALADGQLLQTLTLPSVFAHIRSNLSLESLTWDDASGVLWTANEEALSVDGPVSSFVAGTVVRLQRFDDSFQANGQWAYVTDPLPGDISAPGRDIEVSGVAALVALPDGELLVLERALGAGALLRHRLYQVDFSGATDTTSLAALDSASFTPVAKTLLWSRVVPFANLEGAALGPQLSNGAFSLVLVADDGSGLVQVLYALTVRPVVCGDGFVGGDEACDDGNTVDGDGCTAGCELEFCGDGVINNGGRESCDDGNSGDGDGCSATCGLERAVRLCQEAIARGGRGYFEAQVKVLQGCRNLLNKGRVLMQTDGVTPLAGPDDCALERRSAPKLVRAGTNLRNAIAGRCSDADIAVLGACADTVSGLVGPSGATGCLPDTHRAAVAGMLADQYGEPVPTAQRDLRRCQETIAKASLKYARLHLGSVQSCRNQMNRGKRLFTDRARTTPVLDPAHCATEAGAARKLERGRTQLRAALTRSCSDAFVAELATTCAATVDGLVSPAGVEGCIVLGHDSDVGAMVAAQYRPPMP